MGRAWAAAAIAALTLAPSAQAGSWTRVTGVPASDRTTADAGLARTPDGMLHLLYARGGGIFKRAISADARRLGAERQVAAFAGGANPSVALVAGPAGLRAFFAGLQDGPVDRVLATSSSADGRAWTPAAPVSRGTAPYAASGIAAALGIDGTPLSAWGSAGEGYHVGLDPAAGDGAFPTAGVSGPAAAVDSVTGQAVLAWERVGPGHITAQALVPPSAPLMIPGSGASQALHRVGATGRIGAPGVYVAYTAGANEFTGRAAVWRFGAATGTPVSTPGARHVTIAAAPEGRLWVLWDRDGRIYARRSDRAAATWGRLVTAPAPKRTRAVHDLAGEGSRGPLDVLALAERPGGAGQWHSRLLPGLALETKSKRGRVTLTVTDAGEPVRGVTVRIGGLRAKRTGRAGAVRFALPRGRYRARAVKGGYSPLSAGVRVR